MKQKLFPKEQYHRFLKMDVVQIARFLGETEYKTEIDSLALRYRGVTLLEYALNRNMASCFSRVLDATLPPVQDKLKEYLMKWDIWNVKCLLRGKFAEARPEEILETLVPIKDFDYAGLEKLAHEAHSVNDVIEALRHRSYYRPLKAAASVLETTHDMGPVEDALDNFYYRGIIEYLSSDETEKLVELEVDMRNIITLLRLKKSGYPRADIEKYFLHGGTIPVRMFFGSLAGQEMPEVINTLSRKPMWRYVTVTDINEKEALPRIESALRKYYASCGGYFIHEYSPSLESVIGYFIAKELEVSNIRMIVRMKQAGVPEKEIEDRLVLV